MAVIRGNPKKRAESPTTTSVQANGKIVMPAFSRERILVYGREGSSKTHSWLSIARAYPNVPFYVIDTDDSVQRMLETDYDDLTNVQVAVAQGWGDFESSLREFFRTISAWVESTHPTRKEDYPWIIVDFADSTWDMAQAYFTDQMFNKGIDEYFLEARRRVRGAQLEAFSGWTDWVVIKKIYHTLWDRLTKGGGSYHLYATATAKKTEGIESKSMFGSLKMMPSGEKGMPFKFHTILMLTTDKEGWYISTAKDRGRERVSDKKIANFHISYLRKIAGWEG